MTEQTLVPDSRRKWFPDRAHWELDERTRAIGRRGIERARAELHAHDDDGHLPLERSSDADRSDTDADQS